MEAPFRFPIQNWADVEHLLAVLATSPRLVPGSLQLTEGRELLAQQLAVENRRGDLALLRNALKRGNWASVFRRLWEHPLTAQQPRFLRLEARLAADPRVVLSVRIDVPTTNDWPRWIDLEGHRDPHALALLLDAFRAIGAEAQLRLQEI